MIKNNKIMIILTVLMLSVALLTGCSTGTENGAGLGEEDSANVVSGASTDEGQVAGGEESTTTTTAADKEGMVTDSQADSSQATAKASGTLKSYDADTGMVTLAAQSGDELVLKMTNESKFFIGESPAAFTQLTAAIGSEVNVEYNAKTKTVTAVSIKD